VRRVQDADPEPPRERAPDHARFAAVQVDDVGPEVAQLGEQMEHGRGVADADPAPEGEVSDADAFRPQAPDEPPCLGSHPVRRACERGLPAGPVEAVQQTLDVREHAVLHRLAHEEDAEPVRHRATAS
jgi:hypothetical protein